ncbi:ribonuclease P protein component [Acidisphaera rubrifaciens]|uniref:Ribonuclease P protein component n=1 Tax=Acidisphaera rubrifaciens HS-AP3 TaxID=1231350 RepID=A0A0D6P2A5_9PROT|nr:ribonuclease P protein component [Acidisphaera rubrifaciens]GAN75890.1 ribonuclease P [Acidisphaera rubrifaciens HS-AP3]
MRPERLRHRRDFLLCASKGRKAPLPGLVLQARRREDDGAPRVGFTVTKKIGNAVVRNRTRRRLREAARLVLAADQPAAAATAGHDLVLIGREGTRARDFRVLQDDLRRALRKTGVLP